MEILESKRFRILAYIIWGLALIAMLRDTVYKEKEKEIFFLDICEISSEMDESEQFKIEVDKRYYSKWIDDESLLFQANSKEPMYMLNIRTKELNETKEYPDFGNGYHYNSKIYFPISKKLVIYDSDYNKITKKKFKDDVYSRAYIDNLLIVSLYRSKGIHAVDLDTEEIIWSIERDKITNHLYLEIIGDKLYYLSYGNVYEVNPYTGEEKLVVEGKHLSPYVIDDETMYTTGNMLKKIDMNTWKVTRRQEVNLDKLIIDGNYIYGLIREGDNKLVKLDKDTLKIIWTRELLDGDPGFIELLDDYVSFRNTANQIGLISKETGEIVWGKQFPQDDYRAFAYGYKNLLIVARENGEIFYYDTNTLKNND